MGRNENLKRIIKARKKMEKSMRRLEIARFRRIQAEEGNVIKSIFGKPRRKKK